MKPDSRLAGVVLLFLILGLLFCMRTLTQPDELISLFGVCVIMFAFVVYYVWQIVRASQKVLADQNKGDLSAISGPARLSTKVKQGRVAYALQVGVMGFSLSEDEFYSFRQGDAYTVYYAPHSEIILSAEALE